jgi:hypothetical protein
MKKIVAIGIMMYSMLSISTHPDLTHANEDIVFKNKIVSKMLNYLFLLPSLVLEWDMGI